MRPITGTPAPDQPCCALVSERPFATQLVSKERRVTAQDALDREVVLQARIATLEAQLKDAQARILSIPAPLDEYHEDMRPVVGWAADENGVWLGEPAWIGKPDGSDWPGYHTHWTFHPQFPSVPARAAHVEPTASDEVSRLFPLVKAQTLEKK